MALRETFPASGSDYLGGESDGYEYRTEFGGTTIAQSYEMLCQFLQEEGYAEVPIPANAQDLLLFRNPVKNRQFRLFEEYAYVHNPLKIIFHISKRKSNTLSLCLYNESHPRHLIKFHGLE